MAKLCARYHRFSDKDQSNGSIERQDMVTRQWCQSNEVEIVDTFNDDGYTAKNFDRPDAQKLIAFLKANRDKINYLVVAELTRFSRMLGDAVNLVTEIQNKYGIRIVSAQRSMIYDVKDHTSFLMMALEFAFGNVENIKRESDINGGIYTAKAKDGRYVGAGCPVGYKKERHGRTQRLVVDEESARIVRYIFHAYQHDVPINEIWKTSKKMGFNKKGNSAITNILSNPIYIAKQYVKPWKEMPGGVFDAKHDAIIDIFTFNQVQDKLKGNKKKGFTISEMLPLRGVLHCHCGKKLTGAASRGRRGEYYDYYKGKCGHLNLSAIKAHDQLQQIWDLLSIPPHILDGIKEASFELMDEQLRNNRTQLQKEKLLLAKVQEKLKSLEEKWIANQIRLETYNRWFTDLTLQINECKAAVDKLSRSENEMHLLLEENLSRLTDMGFLYNSCEAVEKQEMIRLVFDHSLYYRDGMYRTPSLLNIFQHNLFILKQKKLLEVDEKRDFCEEIPSGGAAGNRTLVQTYSP